MGKKVSELMISKFVPVQEEEQIYRVVEKVVEDRETMLACVVDRQGKLVGTIRPRELLKAVEVHEFGAVRYPFFEAREALHLLTSRYARDIMGAPTSVRPDDEVEKAIGLMLEGGFYEVPVVDEQGRVLGEINYFSILAASVEFLKNQ